MLLLCQVAALLALGAEPPGAPVVMRVSSCPHPAPAQVAECAFAPMKGVTHRLLKSARRSICPADAFLRYGFIDAEGRPALELFSGGAVFLQRVDDSVIPLPADLTSRALRLGGQTVALVHGPRRDAFWRDGVCEEPSDGQLRQLEVLQGDEAVALLVHDDGQAEVLLRTARGEWRSLGGPAEAWSPQLLAQQGRVAMIDRSADLGGKELTVVKFPEDGHAEVLGQVGTPGVPLEPRAGSRFSDVAVLSGREPERWVSLPEPGGARRRVLLPMPKVKACDGARGSGSHSEVALVTVGTGVAAVWTEQRLPCAQEKGAPTSLTTDLVVFSLGSSPRELARLHLALTNAPWTSALAATATQGSVFVFAWGVLLEFDRAALERELK